MSLSKKETIVKLNKIKNLIESSNRLNEAVDNNLVKEFKNSFKNCQTISSKFVKLNQEVIM